MATTLLPVATAAPMADPMPMPMMAHVAQSTRWRGSDISTVSRVSSSVLAPSFMRIMSGLASSTGFMALSAPQCVIGISLAASARRAANFSLPALVRAWSAGSHAGSVCMVLPSMPAIMASRASPMSPTTGAATGTLRSISVGSTSSCMNLVSGFHLPRPKESIQLRRAPITITTSACSIIIERQEMADSSPVSGISPLAIDIGR